MPTDREPNVEDYAAARRRDDQLIPDLKCEHGSRLRVCGYPTCIAERARRLRKATRDGKRA